MALAEKPGTVSIYVYDQDHCGWNTRADRPLQEYGIDVQPVAVEEVQSTTVDEYCQKNGIEHIDLLKVDVEGMEYQVLQGARRMMVGKMIGCCVFEFGQTTFDAGNTPEQIEDYLGGFGYYIRNVVKRDSCFPGRQSVQEARFSIHVARPR